MSKKQLLVTRRMVEEVERRIARDYDARFNAKDILHSSEELIQAVAGADGLLITSQDLLDAQTLSHLPSSVRVIATVSVGVDHVDLAAAAVRGIQVTNTPDVLTDATADLTILLLLAASRRASEGLALLRSGKWRDPRPTELLGTELTGKILGIYGMGRIGRAVADRARAFGMNIHYTSLRQLSPELERGALFHADSRDLLRVSQFLTLHAPRTKQTARFLNAETIALLPPNAIVVNAARGSLVDDDALIEALRTGRIAAAGLDVYDGEPDLRKEYGTLPNVFPLPHMGSATVETRIKMGMRALDNLDAAFAGKIPRDLVAPSAAGR